MKIDKTIKEYLAKYGDESMASLTWSILWRAWIIMITVGFILGVTSALLDY